jgi:hypothetical protein
MVQTLATHSFIIKCHVVSSYMVHTYKVSTAFSELIFTELKMVSSIMCKSLILNFTQIRQEVWKVQTEINLHPEVKFEYDCTNFDKTHNTQNIFCGHLLCQISYSQLVRHIMLIFFMFIPLIISTYGRPTLLTVIRQSDMCQYF